MSGLVSENTLEQIRAANDIIEVIGSYVPLKKAGANFMGLCPFHREKSPSFSVNPNRQFFHCFGCHKGGDVFTFVKEYENIGFMDAVKRLAERAHIVLEVEQNPGQQQVRHLKDVLLQIHEQITSRWQTALTNDAAGQIARDYLEKRGLSAEAIKLFRLGYAPDLWDDTVNWAKSKNYDLETMEQSGLIIRRESGEGCYDRFRGRLMFPICDEQGRVVAFSGRVLSGDEKTAKYVNSPETPIFTKGKIFYGLDKSKRAILDDGFAIICEGQLDLIACHMAGVKNMVAPQGTAFTGDHARILQRYTKDVVLCFDGDEAGQKATARVVDSLLAAGLSIRVASVPAPHDPDSFIKEQGSEAFKEVVKKAEGFFDYYLKRLCSINAPNTDRGRMAILREMGLMLKKTDNQVLMDTYAQKTALHLGVAPESVMVEFRKTPHAPTHRQEEEPDFSDLPDNTPKPRPSPIELWLLKLLFCADETMAWLAPRIDQIWIQNETVRRIYALRMANHEQGRWNGLASFLGEIEEPELRELITESAMEGLSSESLERQLFEAPLKMQLTYVEQQQILLKQQLGQTGLSDDDVMALLRHKEELNKARRALIGALAQSGQTTLPATN